ncbi:MAG: hypothetical protein MR880_12945 [Negativibacillus massiliensis]|nr:hypothetical protein [Negativibacillus massiliensis]
MKKLFITLLAALTLFAAVPQMCFADEPTTPPTVEQGEGEEGDEQIPTVNPACVNGPGGDVA